MEEQADLSHVTLRCKDEGLETVVGRSNLLRLDHLEQSLQHLGVTQLGVSQDRTPRLDGLDDLHRHDRQHIVFGGHVLR